MPRVLKHLLAVFLIVVVAGCAAGGGGCGGTGMTPLASGFNTEDRVENAGSARITESGIAFLEQNVGVLAAGLLGGSGGVITFSIPASTGSALVDYTICPGGAAPDASPPKCVAELDVGNASLQVEPRGPHNVRVLGPLPVRLQNLPILVDYGFLGEDVPIATLNGNDVCPPATQTFTALDVNVELSVSIDVNPQHSRHGYSRIEVVALDINRDQLESSIHLDCGDSVTGEVLDFLKPIIASTIIDSLIDTLTQELSKQLCQRADPSLSPPCPDGTRDVQGICRYGDDASAPCASILLGIEGQLDLGKLLASISPGTSGGVDILLAGGGEATRDDGSDFAWGDLNPVGNGLTLGMYGGAEPRPVSKCVPLSEIPVPVGIPIPDELFKNTVPDWPAEIPGPHVGVAVSERFLNYALNGMYNSGLLCLGISTETLPILNSGILSVAVAGSLRDLTPLQREPQQIAIAIRPQSPPKATLGDGTDSKSDPLIRLELSNATFDFYVWSLDRFVRFMSATFDLDVPLNLAVGPDGLTPIIAGINVSNGRVTNSDLLRESPEDLAASLADLLSGQVGQVLGAGLGPIDINGAVAGLGLSLVIPESADGGASPGLRRLKKGDEAYLGVFAAFGLSTQAQSALRSDTSAELRSKHVQPEGLRLPTMTRGNGPTAQLVMGSPLDDGTRTVEYSYRIDQGPWRPFTRQRVVELRDGWLRLQGRHVVSVRSRIAGAPLSLDPTPATVEMVVDVDPPAVSLGAEVGGKVALSVRDRVSEAERTSVRVRLDGGSWSPWASAADMTSIEVGDAAEVDVEARDGEGNIGTARQALIRGRIPTDAAGCSCRLDGGTDQGGAGGWLLGLAVAAAVARLRRRGPRATAPQGAPRRDNVGRIACHAAAALSVVVATGAHAGCSCGEDPDLVPQCLAPDCISLQPGLIGAYTSIAVDEGDVWVAGYAEADWGQQAGWAYGDLAVGLWDGESVAWETVDGVPSEPPVDATRFDVKGFRGGQTEAGDDVGLWTSIAIGPDGEPAVAYYDRTNRGLKFAQKQGDGWIVSSVELAANSDIGRYAKLLFVDGVPIIAYLAIKPGEDGAITSAVRIATGMNASPGEDEWRFEDAALDTATPCREHLCATGTKCIQANGRCMEPLAETACSPPCPRSQACVDLSGAPACADVYDGSRIDTYPDALGGYIAMAPDGKGGFGLAFYDRIHGNVMIASKASGRWEASIVDGAAPDGPDTKDVGIGASLFIDEAGDWHLAYADGYAEGLRYARVKGGTEVRAPEVVDDGLGIDGTPFEDGQHVVGDDTSIVVSRQGEVRISYQDATSGTLRLAIGTVSADAHSWRVRAVEQDGFAGAFTKLFQLDGRLLIANFWRVGGQAPRGDVAIVSP